MKVLISGGGTGGHINPGLAIAKEIQGQFPDAQIVFVGTKRGLENELVPNAGYQLKLIDVKGFRRKISLETFISIKELFKGLFQARKILKEFKPDIVVGTGGYVCGPVLFNASLMGIPTAIHEQNAYPGVTNKILSKFVDVIMISFEESRKYFGNKNVILTGNPIRQEIINASRTAAREKLKLGAEKLVVIFGGSLGAEQINEAVIEYIKAGLEEGVKLIWGTGSKSYESVMKSLKDVALKNAQVLPYIEDMGNIMAAADLLICRGGALTLAELTAIGVASVIIPSPNVTHNHQEYNARALEKNDAAQVLLENQLVNLNLKEYIENLLKNDSKLKELASKSKEMGIIDANEKINKIILSLVKK